MLLLRFLMHYTGMMTAATAGPGLLPQQRLVAERRWQLGAHSRGHPSALVAEVMRALQAHGCAWKKQGPYTIKCRMAVGPPSA